MVLLKDRAKKNEEKIKAIFEKLDNMAKEKIEEDKKEAARIAVENYKYNLLKLLWIPIALLLISAALNWIVKFYGG